MLRDDLRAEDLVTEILEPHGGESLPFPGPHDARADASTTKPSTSLRQKEGGAQPPPACNAHEHPDVTRHPLEVQALGSPPLREDAGKPLKKRTVHVGRKT